MIQEALALLATPKTASQLAQALGLRPETAALLLEKLAARGYAQPLGCRGACSVCAFRGVCQPSEALWVRLDPGHGEASGGEKRLRLGAKRSEERRQDGATL
jgi:hypothetical protein